MFPWSTSIVFDRNTNQALYLQLANQIIQLIKLQILKPNTKLPGSRSLATQLKVHRKTIVACYDELLLQGWLESIPKKGTFVHRNLPELKLQKLKDDVVHGKKIQSGFSFYRNPSLTPKRIKKEKDIIYINDGISDARLTPLNEIARTYRRIASKKNVFDHLSYGTTYGNDELRNVLVKYLNSTRGLNVKKENILITRGSQMGIWLSSKLLLKSDDVIVVGKTNYASADYSFINQNAKLLRVSVDDHGMVTEEIETICRKQQIKAVFVTSHHHHPTTVTLSAKRRLHLLNLARQHNFAVIEDDYDYDFNYNHAPILPLASHDSNQNVIYIGSLCKTVAPVFRIGYLIASKEFVDEAAKLRGFIDRQGDALLEMTFASFIKSGDLDRHIRKVLRVYQQRRDLFCQLLKERLSDIFEFEIPIGGMAVWIKLNPKYSWDEFSSKAEEQKVDIGNWRRYDLAKQGHNCIRIGFASFNEIEIRDLINRMERVVQNL